MRSQLRELLTQAIDKTAKGGELFSNELPPLLLEPPKQREFGDLTTNVAMLWAKSAKKAPRAIAELILKNFEDPGGIIARREIAGPGFLNFAFAPKFYYERLRELAADKEARFDLGKGEKVQVEFASVNPTGPATRRPRASGGDRRCFGALAPSHRFRSAKRILRQRRRQTDGEPRAFD